MAESSKFKDSTTFLQIILCNNAHGNNNTSFLFFKLIILAFSLNFTPTCCSPPGSPQFMGLANRTLALT